MTAKPAGEFYPLNDPRVCKDDHLRLPTEIVRDVGQHTIIAAAVYMSMILDPARGLKESQIPPTAVDVLRSTSKPPRAWSPALPKTAPKPKAPPQQAAPESTAPTCHTQGCQVVIEGVPDCHRSACQDVIGPGANLSQGECQIVICNDLPLLPTTLTNPSGPTPLTKNVDLHTAASGSDVSVSRKGKAGQGKAADKTPEQLEADKRHRDVVAREMRLRQRKAPWTDIQRRAYSLACQEQDFPAAHAVLAEIESLTPISNPT